MKTNIKIDTQHTSLSRVMKGLFIGHVNSTKFSAKKRADLTDWVGTVRTDLKKQLVTKTDKIHMKAMVMSEMENS
jgi:hypothetical protein